MRRTLLYISALASIGIAIAQQSALPRTAPEGQSPVSADTVENNIFVPVDSLSLDIDSIRVNNDTLFFGYDSIFATTDSIISPQDSITDAAHRARRGSALPADSSRSTLTRINRNKVDLDAAVVFDAKDSLVMIGQNNAYLYGDSKVEYGQFKLNAQEIQMNLDNSTVHALGAVDSTGNLTGTPVFSDGGDEYQSKEMTYNFKTERGFITNVITEQGEGYLTSEASKKMEDGSFFVENGKYTTCDDHEHPHFYFNVTRGKMVPKKNIVTGPVYMVLADAETYTNLRANET
ncbi:MAG: hypothetical protein K2J48_07780, partial [Muribaculaceae bacterium]|nr:hypothetical protein [Muribaculaceae bacterium]